MRPFVYIIGDDGHLINVGNFSSGYIKSEFLESLISAASKTLAYNLANNISDEFIEKADRETIEAEMLEISSTPKKKRCDNSSLYLIHDTISNCLKIGKSINVKSRFRQLQIGTPNKLELLFQLPLQGQYEKQFHDTFSHLRLTGEWFSYNQEIINYFKHCL